MQCSASRVMLKSATNVNVRRDLLEAAHAAGVNFSAALEAALIERLKEIRQNKWREENRDAIAAYNERVSKHGVFSDNNRTF